MWLILENQYGQNGYNTATTTAITALTSGYSLKWAAASLKGAWEDHIPNLHDVITNKDDCGPWLFEWLYQCEKHDLYLNHPYNDICDTNTYANACTKNFMAVYTNPDTHEGDPHYVVDPWVPVGVDKNLLLKNINTGKNYAESLNASFLVGKRYMTNGSADPGMNAESYAQFGLRFSSPTDFVLTKNTIEEIRDTAQKCVVDQGFFLDTDTANLNAFADYAYEFHFIRPKASRSSEISYPLIGLQPYLDLMANGVAARIGTGGGMRH